MKATTTNRNGTLIALVSPGDALIADGQSALDVLMTVCYDTGARHIALPSECLDSAFFNLSTGIAGEVLQKVVNYNLKLAIWGDFSGYTSEPLLAFIAESNRGNAVFFCKDEEAAGTALSETR